MKELLKEYQSVLITSIASIIVFICAYSIFPQVVKKTVELNVDDTSLEIIRENNDDYNFTLNYPNGKQIKVIKGQKFNIEEYITILDKNNGEVDNYDYTLNINGKKVNNFDTNTCGGFYIYANIIYRNTIMQGELLVIIEER